MNKRISLGAAVAVMLIVAALTFSITMNYANTQFNLRMNDLKERETQFAKYAEINTKVREYYLGTIDETALNDAIARGYIEGIGDKYGAYIDARAYERLLRTQQGQTAGIGAVVRVSPEGYLSVDVVYPDSPAENQGIETGDLIVRIDGNDITQENSTQMLASIQGDTGTKINLVVRKGNEDIPIELTRRPVAIPSVSSRMITDTTVGYIRITEFNANTHDQFSRELQKMINAGARSIIFDVRDNKGGVLRSATRALDRLLPAGKIVSAAYKDNTTTVLETSDANELQLPMVVLTNSGTASSAELFAQALRDYGKAYTVGTATAGKGVMQEIVKLSDGSAIEITTATLLSPSGETWNETGVKPDFDVAAEEEWQNLDENTDPQLKKALDLALAAEKAAEGQSGSESPSQENGESSGPAESGQDESGESGEE